MTRTEKIKQQLRRKPKAQQLITPDRLLSTGSTLLNLACSGRSEGGFLRGTYVFFVGDSVSGKTFVALTCLAEAAKNPTFDGYRFIYDATEHGALMDFAKFFGQAVADRVESPAVIDGQSHFSVTAEDFYFHLDDAFKEGRPFIYVLDSQDALSSEAEVSKFDERRRASRKGKETAGSYGDSKAKIHSANIRRVIGELERTGSILIVINQTRDSFDVYEKKSYSGGRALKFYATIQLWSSVAGRIERTIKGKKRELGIVAKVRVVKSRVAGKDRTVRIPIYHSCGIDETGSLAEYLVEEGVWKKERGEGAVEVIGMGPGWTAKSLEHAVRRIEAEGMEDDLRELVVQSWNDIERACEVPRKKRYQ